MEVILKECQLRTVKVEIVSTALWNGVGPQDTPPLSFLN